MTDFIPGQQTLHSRSLRICLQQAAISSSCIKTFCDAASQVVRSCVDTTPSVCNRCSSAPSKRARVMPVSQSTIFRYGTGRSSHASIISFMSPYPSGLWVVDPRGCGIIATVPWQPAAVGAIACLHHGRVIVRGAEGWCPVLPFSRKKSGYVALVNKRIHRSSAAVFSACREYTAHSSLCTRALRGRLQGRKWFLCYPIAV